MAKRLEDDLFTTALNLDKIEEKEERETEAGPPAWKTGETEVEFATLYKELLGCGEKFIEYFGMSENQFKLKLKILEY